MTHQEDVTNLILAQLQDRKPKCASCRQWRKLASDATAGVCATQGMATTDLTVCSGWIKIETE